MSRSAFSGKLFSFLNILEKILLVLFIAGAALKFTHNAGAAELLMISMTGIAAISFLSAYKPVELEQDHPNNYLLLVVVKVGYIGIAVCTIGLLFYLLKMNGHKEMLMIGSLSMASTSIFGVFLMTQIEKSAVVLRPVLLRGIPLAVAGAFILLVK